MSRPNIKKVSKKFSRLANEAGSIFMRIGAGDAPRIKEEQKLSNEECGAIYDYLMELKKVSEDESEEPGKINAQSIFVTTLAVVVDTLKRHKESKENGDKIISIRNGEGSRKLLDLCSQFEVAMKVIEEAEKNKRSYAAQLAIGVAGFTALAGVSAAVGAAAAGLNLVPFIVAATSAAVTRAKNLASDASSAVSDFASSAVDSASSFSSSAVDFASSASSAIRNVGIGVSGSAAELLVHMYMHSPSFTLQGAGASDVSLVDHFRKDFRSGRRDNLLMISDLLSSDSIPESEELRKLALEEFDKIYKNPSDYKNLIELFITRNNNQNSVDTYFFSFLDRILPHAEKNGAKQEVLEFVFSDRVMSEGRVAAIHTGFIPQIKKIYTENNLSNSSPFIRDRMIEVEPKREDRLKILNSSMTKHVFKAIRSFNERSRIDYIHQPSLDSARYFLSKGTEAEKKEVSDWMFRALNESANDQEAINSVSYFYNVLHGKGNSDVERFVDVMIPLINSSKYKDVALQELRRNVVNDFKLPDSATNPNDHANIIHANARGISAREVFQENRENAVKEVARVAKALSIFTSDEMSKYDKNKPFVKLAMEEIEKEKNEREWNEKVDSIKAPIIDAANAAKDWCRENSVSLLSTIGVLALATFAIVKIKQAEEEKLNEERRGREAVEDEERRAREVAESKLDQEFLERLRQRFAENKTFIEGELTPENKNKILDGLSEVEKKKAEEVIELSGKILTQANLLCRGIRVENVVNNHGNIRNLRVHGEENINVPDSKNISTRSWKKASRNYSVSSEQKDGENLKINSIAHVIVVSELVAPDAAENIIDRIIGYSGPSNSNLSVNDKASLATIRNAIIANGMDRVFEPAENNSDYIKDIIEGLNIFRGIPNKQREYINIGIGNQNPNDKFKSLVIIGLNKLVQDCEIMERENMEKKGGDDCGERY